jgi:hypothetical protein
MGVISLRNDVPFKILNRNVHYAFVVANDREGPSQCHKIVTFWNKKTAVLATGVRAAAL